MYTQKVVIVDKYSGRPVSIDTDGQILTLSALQDENGTAYGVKHIDNKPRIIATPYLYEIAKSNVPDHHALNKFGHNASVGTSWETIWTGSNVYPYMTVADQLELLSDSVADTNTTGTGAWTVRLQGLDTNYAEASEIIALDGTNVVTTTTAFLRIFRVRVLTAGTGGINAGTITIRDQDTDTTRALIDPSIGQTLMATWTVPAGYTFYMTSWYASSAISKLIDIGIFARDNDITNAALQNKHYGNFTDSVFHHPFDLPLVFTEKTDIEVRAMVSVAGGNISAGFDGWYEL